MKEVKVVPGPTEAERKAIRLWAWHNAPEELRKLFGGFHKASWIAFVPTAAGKKFRDDLGLTWDEVEIEGGWVLSM